MLAGLVSFASPCVLPLVPGYLGYVSGMAGADRARRAAPPGAAGPARRDRVAAGVALFVAGFTVVFVALGALAGSLGGLLVRVGGHDHARARRRRDPHGPRRSWALCRSCSTSAACTCARARACGARRCSAWSSASAGRRASARRSPPCRRCRSTTASAGRGALLGVAYCLGLGVPFLLVALCVVRSAGLGFLRRHRLAIMRIGGALLVLVGLALVTGLWGHVDQRGCRAGSRGRS